MSKPRASDIALVISLLGIVGGVGYEIAALTGAVRLPASAAARVSHLSLLLAFGPSAILFCARSKTLPTVDEVRDGVSRSVEVVRRTMTLGMEAGRQSAEHQTQQVLGSFAQLLNGSSPNRGADAHPPSTQEATRPSVHVPPSAT